MSFTLALLLLQSPSPSVTPPTLEPLLACDEVVRDFSIDARGEVLVTLTEKELVCWKLDRKEALWRAPAHAQRWVSHCGDSVLCGYPICIVDSFEAKSGKSESGVGGSTAGLAKSCFAADPKGRWAWFGGDQGLERLTPGNVNGWSRRKVEDCTITALAIDAEGEQLAVGCGQGVVRFANSESANVDKKKLLEGSGSPVTAMVFADKVLVVADRGGAVVAWTVASCKRKLVLQENGASVLALAAYAKEDWIASADAEGALVLRKLDKGAELGRWTLEGGKAPARIAFTPKQRLLFVATDKAILRVDLSTLE